MEKNPKYYGETVAYYEGFGVLTLVGGGNLECKFEAFQLVNAKIVVLVTLNDPSLSLLLWNPVEQLSGYTHAGQKVTASGFFPAYCPTDFRFTVSRLRVESSPTASPYFWRFKVANAILGEDGLLRIGHPKGTATLRVIADYAEAEARLKGGIQDIVITTVLELSTNTQEDAEDIAEDICYLLSLAQGTKINWILAEGCVDRDVVSVTNHRDGIIKRHGHLTLVDPRYTEQFLQTTISSFISKQQAWSLRRELIDSYLDAKSEGDYLESRAIKLAATIERFKRIFIQATGYEDLAVSNEVFKDALPDLEAALKTVLRNHRLNSKQTNLVCKNLAGANRKPFGNIIAKMHQHFQLPISDADRNLFVSCRNSLVHDGRFYCESASDEDRVRVPPRVGKTEEYLWLLHAVDRLFLRLVDYDGPYIDWTKPNEPIHREKVLA
jgi:hypothetical protein